MTPHADSLAKTEKIVIEAADLMLWPGGDIPNQNRCKRSIALFNEKINHIQFIVRLFNQ